MLYLQGHNFLAEDSVVQYYLSSSGILLLQFTTLVVAIYYAVMVHPYDSFLCGILWNMHAYYTVNSINAEYQYCSAFKQIKLKGRY